jgi:hypothetical protein
VERAAPRSPAGGRIPAADGHARAAADDRAPAAGCGRAAAGDVIGGGGRGPASTLSGRRGCLPATPRASWQWTRTILASGLLRLATWRRLPSLRNKVICGW